MTDVKEKTRDNASDSTDRIVDRFLVAKPGADTATYAADLNKRIASLKPEERISLEEEIDEIFGLDSFFDEIDRLNTLEKRGERLASDLISLQEERNIFIQYQADIKTANIKIEKNGSHKEALKKHLEKTVNIEELDLKIETLLAEMQHNFKEIEGLRVDLRAMYRDQVFPLGKTLSKRNEILDRIKAKCKDGVLLEEILCDGLTEQLKQRKDAANKRVEPTDPTSVDFMTDQSTADSDNSEKTIETVVPPEEKTDIPAIPDEPLDSGSNLQPVAEPIEPIATEESIASSAGNSDEVDRAGPAEGETLTDPAVLSTDTTPPVVPAAETQLPQRFINQIKRLSPAGLFKAMQHMGRIKDTSGVAVMEKRLIELRSAEDSIQQDLENNLVGKN